MSYVIAVQWSRCHPGASTSRGTPTARSSSKANTVAMPTSVSSVAGRATLLGSCREHHHESMPLTLCWQVRAAYDRQSGVGARGSETRRLHSAC